MTFIGAGHHQKHTTHKLIFQLNLYNCDIEPFMLFNVTNSDLSLTL